MRRNLPYRAGRRLALIYKLVPCPLTFATFPRLESGVQEDFFSSFSERLAKPPCFVGGGLYHRGMQVATVHRTARIALRTTKAQRTRCFGILRSAGDVRAFLLDCNRQLILWGLRPITNYQALCRELSGTNFGELGVVGARSVLRAYSAQWFEAVKRRSRGERAGFPRRKKALVPVRYYHHTFGITQTSVRLPTAQGSPPLKLRLSRPVPYPVEAVRSVTLLFDAGRLYLDVTAQLEVEPANDRNTGVAGVDLGVIHPLAVAAEGGALLVSGRALRAQERLHLEDTKARQKKMATKTPKRGQRGSRRYRKLRRSQRKAEARHRRKIRQAHHEAAKQAIEFAKANKVGTFAIGDLKGIASQDHGAVMNLRLRQWRRTHLVDCLKDKAEMAGIKVVAVDERGSSSTCPRCKASVTKPKGRVFSCNSCGLSSHRDVVGATNIAAKGGGSISQIGLIEHRRAGKFSARRDRRRHLFDLRRSCPASGRRGIISRSRSPMESTEESSEVGTVAVSAAVGEDPSLMPKQGKGYWTRH